MSFREQRRFPRVSVKGQTAELSSILGGHLAWPNLEVTEIMDLSYRGMAARRPGMFPMAVQNELRLEVRLGTVEPFAADMRVAWCNLDMVGLELKSVPPEGHRAMAEFLDAKLVGTALRPVERAFFSKGQNFQVWFQGPGGLHVFIWTNPSHTIERVAVNFADRTLEFQRGTKVSMSDSDQRRALLVLSQVDKPDLPVEEFLRTLGVDQE